ncbi:hypothetical protein P43SY_005518 [Pythium insidiosum]|uniref:Uncharacterized protein n=1 Tax=Pythium insidiosum TaxID=114742 RepID=A0AAD5LLZ0_PYTIN|nr:hypothetical protein P43SY_005518 [Pythium insidiosum]
MMRRSTSEGRVAMERAPTVELLLAAETEAPAAKDDAESPVVRRIRRQVVARGLARQYGELKAREASPQKRVTRQQRQQAIIDNYRRKQALHEERLKQVDATLQRSLHTKATVTDDSVVVPVQRGNGLSKQRTSLRRLPDGPTLELSPSKNQLEHDPLANEIDAFALESTSPLKLELTERVSRPFSTQQPPTDVAKSSSLGRRGAPDTSSAQVLCEIQLTKDIHLREHTVEQIHAVVSTLEQLATELAGLTQRKGRLEAAALAAVAGANASSSSSSSAAGGSSAKRGSVTLAGPVSVKRPESGTDKASVAKESALREKELRECEARAAELSAAARKRMAQLRRLIGDLQSLTVAVVEAIVEWRRLRTQRVALSNRQARCCFAWPPRATRNYLLALDDDLRDLFPTAALAVCLGADAVYNALLLSRRVLDGALLDLEAESSGVSTTFLTERQLEATQPPVIEAAGRTTAASPPDREAVSALARAVKAPRETESPPAVGSLDRFRRCLKTIHDERVADAAATQAQAFEAQRLETAYNPFNAIKLVGGVEQTLTRVLEREAPHASDLAVQLRRRQEDTRRLQAECVPEPAQSQSPGPRQAAAESVLQATPHKQPLVVNPTRLRRLLERRREATEAATDCELQDVSAWGTRNKLPGQRLVRRVNVRRLETQHARKIQRQFQAHRRRVSLLRNLSLLVLRTRHHVVQIQKVFRGFQAKKAAALERLELARRQQQRDAARRIWLAFKRFKRRQRHRMSLSVESVAEFQLHLLQQEQLLAQHEMQQQLEADGDAAERYRRAGEERRRQRAVVLQRRRQELLAHEAKLHAAAVRIQSLFRMHAARQQAQALRGERRAHLSAVSAMMIQSTIRRFLRQQEKRRRRFHSDLERVNRSAVRIQSIFRGYNSRTELLSALDGRLRQTMTLPVLGGASNGEQDEEEEEEEQEDEAEEEQESSRLPAISRPASRQSAHAGEEEEGDGATAQEGLHAVLSAVAAPSAPAVSLPPLRPRAMTTIELPRRPSFQRQATLSKVQLKLKETVIGDGLEAQAPVATRRAQGGGSHRSQSLK